MNHQPPPLITVPLDLSDEAATRLIDLLLDIAHRLANHYSEQLYRYHKEALRKMTLNERNVEALVREDRPFIAWDDRLTGFGVRVQPSGVRSYIVNYRAGEGGRNAANRRLVIARHGGVIAEQARRLAQKTLGQVAYGEDPAAARARSRAVPTLCEAFEDYLGAGPKRKDSTLAVYRSTVHKDLGDWLDRSLEIIERRDIEQRFQLLSEKAGGVQANNAMKMLRVLYRRQCIDHEGLHNPVDQWRADGGRPHRRRIPAPAEVLPSWHRGFETAVRNDVTRDAFRFGLYTGMRRAEVFGLEWARVDMDRAVRRVEDTKSGEPLEFPVTRQLATIVERWLAELEHFAVEARGWVFPSEISGSGHLEGMQHLNARIGEAGARSSGSTRFATASSASPTAT